MSLLRLAEGSDDGWLSLAKCIFKLRYILIFFKYNVIANLIDYSLI